MSWLAAKRYPGFCKKFNYTIRNYDIELKIDPRRRNYKSNASLTLTADKNSRQFCFLLSDQCGLDSVNYLGIPLSHTVKPAHPGLNLITATLPRKADVGEKLVIAFIYTGTIPAHDGSSIELSPDNHWYPFSLVPQSYKSTLNIITPDSMRIVASGQFIREQPADTRVLTQWAVTSPARGIHMLAGEFSKTSRDTQPPLDVYYPRSLMNQGRTVANHGQKIQDFLSAKLGPAPALWGTIILTDDPQPATNSSFYLSSIKSGVIDQIKEYKSSRDRNMRMYHIIAGIMAQRWLKHHLVLAHPRELWYLDGLAEYLSWLALEEEYDVPTREALMLEARERVIARSQESVQGGAEGISRQFPPWLISKASWIIRVAHCLAGEKFLPALQEFYTQCPNPAPTPEGFFRLLGQLTATDMVQVFQEWADSAKQLRAEIQDARTFQDNLGQWQLVFNLVNTGKLNWPYPIDIKMELADGTAQTEALIIQRNPHLITSAAKITKLTVDPEMKFLNWADKATYSM